MISLANAKIKNNKLPVRLFLGDVRNIHFLSNKFDVVFVFTVLHHVVGWQGALKEINRVLKPGGIVSLCELFIDPDYPLRKTEKKWAKKAGLEFHEGFGNFFVYQLNFIKKRT